MATEELGPIETSRAPDVPNPSQIDVLGGVMEAAGAVGEFAKNKIIRGAEGEMNEATDAALREAEKEVEEPVVELTADPVANELLGRISRLEAQRDAATGSTRLRVQQEIRKIRADVSRKFPGLADELAGSVSAHESLDPEFAMLAGIDARNAQIVDTAQEELDEIKDFAYKRADQGGLGMTPGLHDFGSKPFALYFSRMGQIVEDSNMKQVLLDNAKISTDLNVRQKAEVYQDWITGAAAPFRQSIQTAVESTFSVARASINPTNPGASAALLEWENGGRQAALGEIQAARVGLVDEFNSTFGPNDRTSSEFAGIQKQFDDEVAALDALAKAIVDENWSVVKAYEAYDAMKRIEIEADNPQAVQVGRYFRIMDKVFEHTDDSFAGEGKLLRNDWSNYALLALGNPQKFFGFEAGMGSGVRTDSPEAVKRAIQERLAANPDPLGTGQRGRGARQTEAYTVLSLSTDQALDMPVEVSPERATWATNTRSGMLYMMMDGDPASVDPVAARQSLNVIGEEKVVKQAELATPAERVALGRAARDLAVGQQDNRINTYERLKGQELAPGYGIAVSDVIKLDVDSIKTGKPKFVVDTKALDQLATVRTRGNQPLDRDAATLQLARNKAMQTASDLNRFVGEDLRALYNIEQLLGTEKTYEQVWDEQLFGAHFFSLSDAEAE